MPYYSRADVVRLMAERYNTISNVSLGGFRSQLQASYCSSHTEEFWYNKTVCGWQYIYISSYHLVVQLARISLPLSRHFSLSFIASGRSSGLHPVSSHSCWMYVRAGRPTFARPYVGAHRSTSLTSSSLLLQQCPACLVRLTWIVFVVGGRWPYSWCLVGFANYLYICNINMCACMCAI